MAAILTILLDLDPPAGAHGDHPELDHQLERWAHRRPGPAVPGPIGRRGILVWTRLHGVLSLEIEGHFTAMEFDPALLSAEVDALLDGG